MTLSGKGSADQYCLAARFVDGPHVSAPDIAGQRLADWLSDLALEQAAAVSGFINQFPRVKAILLGIAEASPYRFDLVREQERRRAHARGRRRGLATREPASDHDDVKAFHGGGT